MGAAEQRAYEQLGVRRQAYLQTFRKQPKYFWFLRAAYKYVFNWRRDAPANIDVLVDLARFCRANESCFVPGDTEKTLMLEGRREVWIRIQQHLGLTQEQCFALYTGGSALNIRMDDND